MFFVILQFLITFEILMRPICVNPGCGKFSVPMRGRVGQPGVRYRVFCGECHISSYTETHYDPELQRLRKTNVVI